MVKLFACGDIVNYEHSDGMFISNDLIELICSADYAVCNFEAPIKGYGNPQPKSGPHNCQQPKTIEGLKSQGFQLLLLANNHIMDYGQAALEATISQAHAFNFDVIGAGLTLEEAYSPLVKTINGLKIGMVNACEAQFGVIDFFRRNHSAGYAWINHPLIDKVILQLQKECDFVIVFSHAGLEHYSIPQKEWRERYKHFCDLGADVIIGSHPHVPQGYEIYQNSLIFYSLGNFYFNSKKYKPREDASFSVFLKLQRDKIPEFELIFHYKKSGLVQCSPNEKNINLDQLNIILGKDYERNHDAMSLDAYNKISKNLLLSILSTNLYNGRSKSILKKILSVAIGKRKIKNQTKQALHLIRNEAYYYAARHALEILAREKYF